MPFGERGSILGGFPRFDGGNNHPRFYFYRKSKERTEDFVRGDYSSCWLQREETRPLSMCDDYEEAWCKPGDSSSSSEGSTLELDSGSPESGNSFHDDRSAKCLIPYRADRRSQPSPLKSNARPKRCRLPGSATKQSRGSTFEKHRYDDGSPAIRSDETHFTAAFSISNQKQASVPPPPKPVRLAIAKCPRYENIEYLKLQPGQPKSKRFKAWKDDREKPPKPPKRFYISENISSSLHVGRGKVVEEENYSRRTMAEYSASEFDMTINSALPNLSENERRAESYRRKEMRQDESNCHMEANPAFPFVWQTSSFLDKSHKKDMFPNQNRVLPPPAQEEKFPSVSDNDEEGTPLSSHRRSASAFESNQDFPNSQENDYLPTSVDNQQLQILHTVVFKNSNYESPEVCFRRQWDTEGRRNQQNLGMEPEYETLQRDGPRHFSSKQASKASNRSLSRQRQRSRGGKDWDAIKPVEPTSNSASATAAGSSPAFPQRRRVRGRRRGGTTRKVSFQSPVSTLLPSKVHVHGRAAPNSSERQQKHEQQEQMKVLKHFHDGRDERTSATEDVVGRRHLGFPGRRTSLPARDDVIASSLEETTSSSSSDEDFDSEFSWSTAVRQSVQNSGRKPEEKRAIFKTRLRYLWSLGLVTVLVVSVCVELAAVSTGPWAVHPDTSTVRTTCSPLHVCRDQVCQRYPDGELHVAAGLVCVAVGLLLQLLSVCILVYTALHPLLQASLHVSICVFAAGIFQLASVAFFWHNLQEHCAASRQTLSREDSSLIAFLAAIAISGTIGLAGMIWQIGVAYSRFCGTIVRRPPPVTWV